ncbi:uncharacterized protein LOC122543919 isoform X3 [Chiloscyllium plagiosum]|uniref:uncharacterized protein LOC122543919 isoform X3 n=1 Tax=Chiloscyllium plagiosum TaxID=36176 RepID=UPI001CB80B55|nr:uncharacterized protein LOC122543919 isoform X3 [Chiloscyllium plagiosum]
MISVRNSRTLSSNSKFTKVELWYEIHNGIPEGAGGREDKTPDPALLPIRLVGGPAPSSGPAPLYLASLSIALRPRSGACALWTTGRCDGQLSDLPANLPNQQHLQPKNAMDADACEHRQLQVVFQIKSSLNQWHPHPMHESNMEVQAD